jgi:hypothetical protein
MYIDASSVCVVQCYDCMGVGVRGAFLRTSWKMEFFRFFDLCASRVVDRIQLIRMETSRN